MPRLAARWTVVIAKFIDCDESIARFIRFPFLGVIPGGKSNSSPSSLPHAEGDGGLSQGALAVLGDRETMNFYPQVYSKERGAAMIRQSIETHRHLGCARRATDAPQSGQRLESIDFPLTSMHTKPQISPGIARSPGIWRAPEAISVTDRLIDAPDRRFFRKKPR